MRPEDSLPYSQKPTADPCPDPDESSHITPSYFSNNSLILVRKRTIQTERPPHVREVSANFCG
jgi:hypothetical protein